MAFDESNQVSMWAWDLTNVVVDWEKRLKSLNGAIHQRCRPQFAVPEGSRGLGGGNGVH